MIYFINLILVIIYALVLKPDNSKRNKKLFLSIVFIQICAIVTLRSYRVGYDAYNYRNIYYNAVNGNLFLLYYLEQGYVWINRITAYLFGGNYIFLWLVCSIITIYPIIRYIYHYSSNAFISVFTYLCMGFYYEVMNTIRASMAVAICVIAMEMVNRKKYLWAVLISMLAYTIHNSTIIFIVFICGLFCTKKMPKERLFKIICVGLLFVFIVLNQAINLIGQYFTIFNSYFQESYLATHLSGSVSSYIIVYIAIAMFAFAVRRKYISENKINLQEILMDNSIKKTELYDNYLIAMLINLGILVFGIKMHILIRFASFFDIYCCFLLPECMSCVNKSKNNRIIVNIGIVLCMVAITVYYINLSNKAGIYPYEFFWEVKE